MAFFSTYFVIFLKILGLLPLFGKQCDTLDRNEFWSATDFGLETDSAVVEWHVSLAKTGQSLGLVAPLLN